jgi:hypothetical protein
MPARQVGREEKYPSPRIQRTRCGYAQSSDLPSRGGPNLSNGSLNAPQNTVRPLLRLSGKGYPFLYAHVFPIPRSANLRAAEVHSNIMSHCLHSLLRIVAEKYSARGTAENHRYSAIPQEPSPSRRRYLSKPTPREDRQAALQLVIDKMVPTHKIADWLWAAPTGPTGQSNR